MVGFSLILGLYLEGARWNDAKHILDDSKPKELYSEMPMIWFLPKKDREKPQVSLVGNGVEHL